MQSESQKIGNWEILAKFMTFLRIFKLANFLIKSQNFVILDIIITNFDSQMGLNNFLACKSHIKEI